MKNGARRNIMEGIWNVEKIKKNITFEMNNTDKNRRMLSIFILCIFSTVKNIAKVKNIKMKYMFLSFKTDIIDCLFDINTPVMFSFSPGR